MGAHRRTVTEAMSMTGSFLRLGACLVLALAGFVCGGAAADSPKLKIGVTLPLTGDAAGLGKTLYNGIMLAFESLPREEQERITLLFEDDGLSPSRTVSAFNKLVKIDRVDTVVAACSNTAKAVAPLADRERIPLIALATDAGVSRGREYVVNLYATDEEEARAAAAEALRRGYKRIARAATIQDFALATRHSFDFFAAGRIEAVVDAEFLQSEKDFRSFIARVVQRQNELDALALHLMPGQLGIFAKQARSMGVTLPFFGFEMLEDYAEVKAAEGALVGAWYVNAQDPTDEYTRRYSERFPGESQMGFACGHDALMMIVEATRSGGAAEGASVREKIRSFIHTVKDFSGAYGTYSATGANQFTIKAVVKEVLPDGFRVLPR